MAQSSNTNLNITPKSDPEDRPDVAALMLRIRENVREELQKNGSKKLKFDPLVTSTDAPGTPVLYSEELNYLNAHWHDWYSPQQIQSHRRFFGKFIVKAKRFIMNTLWNNLLRDYVERERQYQMNLIRFLNSTARYIDARDKEIFWQLVQKVDNDLSGTHERTDLLLSEVDGTLRSVEKGMSERLTNVESSTNAGIARVDQCFEQVRQLDDVARGLERTLALFARSGAESKAQDSSSLTASVPTGPRNVDYLLFENRFRGSEELIKERMKFYRDLFAGTPGEILDIGCGRGELLELFAEANQKARGIDLDPAMVARSREKGLDVSHAEARAYLAQLPERSLGGILASQVVEHLKQDELESFIELAKSRLVSGGKLVLETINPQSMVALSWNFFRDPTHVWPVHPDTLRFVVEMKGFATTDVQFLSPYPKEAMLQPVTVSDYLPAGWKGTLNELNQNIERLNTVLFGHQDYCVIGTNN